MRINQTRGILNSFSGGKKGKFLCTDFSAPHKTAPGISRHSHQAPGYFSSSELPGFISQAINEDSKAVQSCEEQQPHTDVVTDTTGGFGGSRKVPEEILTRKIPFPPHREFLKPH